MTADDDEETERLNPVLPTVEKSPVEQHPPKGLHPAFFIMAWIALSSYLILFNKQVLGYGHFSFPIILTTWHLVFATIMTQILARCTTLLDGRNQVKMTGRMYLRSIVPIGIFFSLSLICGNMTYLYLSVPFIQMLKSTTPVIILIFSWLFNLEETSLGNFVNVCIIVFGVMIACFGEINFVFIGVLYQIGGIIFEAIRLVMVQYLLTSSSSNCRMDPLVSLYYFAPVCAFFNGLVSAIVELPRFSISDVLATGLWTLLANAMVAFMLNVSVVFLISRTSSLIMRLCGILKDILIVVLSFILWSTPMSSLQVLGYSISLCSLAYYTLGYENIVGAAMYVGMFINNYGVKKRIVLTLLTFFVGLVVVLLIMAFLTVKFIPEEVYDLQAGIYELTTGDIRT